MHLQKYTCGLLAGFNVERPGTDYSPILVRNAIQFVPGVFGSLESLSFALGASRWTASGPLTATRLYLVRVKSLPLQSYHTVSSLKSRPVHIFWQIGAGDQHTAFANFEAFTKQNPPLSTCLSCRGLVTVSESLNFDVINENANRGRLKGVEQMRLRDMTLMEFHSRVAGGWDPLYFAREFYLFSGRLPRWFQQGNFQDTQPLTCLKEFDCPGCSRPSPSTCRILDVRSHKECMRQALYCS